MTKDELLTAMACDSLKKGKDCDGEKVLVPVYRKTSCIGLPLYAFGDGSRDGWTVGEPEKCLAYFRRYYAKKN